MYLCVCVRSEEHTSELQSHLNLVCRLLLEKTKSYSTTRLRAPSATRARSRDVEYTRERRGSTLRSSICATTTSPAATIQPFFFFLMIGRPRRSTFFPYTTLFR